MSIVRILVIYKDNTDHARDVLTFLHDFEHQTGHQLEVLDPETPEGVHICQTYDILRFPTIIATSDSGELQNQWIGLPLPTISELSFYIQ